MATAQENLARFQEIARRGLQDRLPDDIRARFDEAVRRGLVETQQSAAQPEQSRAEPQQSGPPSMRKFTRQRFGEFQSMQPETGGFPEEAGETRAAQELPELQSSGLLSDKSAREVATVVPAILTATNPQEVGQIITENFPEIGITQDPGGNFIATNNKTGAQAIINKPGPSMFDALQIGSIMAAFQPAGRAALAPSAMTGRAATAGAASGATQAGIEGAQSFAGGEFNVGDIALATGAGAGAVPAVERVIEPAVRRGVQAVRSRLPGEAGQAGRESAEAAAEARQAERALRSETVRETTEEFTESTRGTTGAGGGFDEAAAASQEQQAFTRAGDETFAPATQREGIDLLPAQRSLDPSDLATQKILAELPQTSRQAMRALSKQSQQAEKAVSELLADIAPDTATIQGPKRFVQAANKAIEARKAAREEAAQFGKAIRQADARGVKVNKQPILDEIDNAADDFVDGSKIKAKINKYKKQVRGAKNMRQLQGVRREIWDEISRTGDSSIGNEAKRILNGIRKKVTAEMENASDEFSQANKIFREQSGPVNEIESILGNVAKLEDDKLKRVSQQIFDISETNPTVIRRAKQAIEGVDPDAWNLLFRNEIERRMLNIKPGVGESIENVPGKLLNKIFGNQKQRQALFAGAPKGMRTRLEALEKALQRAQLGRPGGSDTAGKQEAIARIRGGGLAAQIARWLRSPLSKAEQTGRDARFNRRVKVLTKTFFDPKHSEQVDEILELPLRQQGPAMAQLLQEVDDVESE